MYLDTILAILLILIISSVVLYFLVRAKLDSTMKRILIPLVATILIMVIFGVIGFERKIVSFFYSIGIYLDPLKSLIFQVIAAVGIYFGIYFIVKKRRASTH